MCSLFNLLDRFTLLGGCAGADAGVGVASSVVAAFAAGAGLLLSGGHDALLDEGRR